MKIEQPLAEFEEPKFGTELQTVVAELIVAHNRSVKRIKELELSIRMLSEIPENEAN